MANNNYLVPFPCDKCGICCCHVNLLIETQFLDRGDGVCLAYNPYKKLCRIYAIRPYICRVAKQYSEKYTRQYSWQEFIELNQIACHILKTNLI